MLDINTRAPDFSLLNQDNELVTLSKSLHNYTLIYFYPKDDTPGCTKEACMIRDIYNDFAKMGIQVFGISADSPASHTKFKAKYELPFTLLSDTNNEVMAKYQANGILLSKRISYLVNKDQIIIKAYPKVDPASHALQILNDVRDII